MDDPRPDVNFPNGCGLTMTAPRWADHHPGEIHQEPCPDDDRGLFIPGAGHADVGGCEAGNHDRKEATVDEHCDEEHVPIVCSGLLSVNFPDTSRLRSASSGLKLVIWMSTPSMMMLLTLMLCCRSL